MCNHHKKNILMDSKRIKDDITGRKVWQVIVRDMTSVYRGDSDVWSNNPVSASVFSSKGEVALITCLLA